MLTATERQSRSEACRQTQPSKPRQGETPGLPHSSCCHSNKSAQTSSNMHFSTSLCQGVDTGRWWLCVDPSASVQKLQGPEAARGARGAFLPLSSAHGCRETSQHRPPNACGQICSVFQKTFRGGEERRPAVCLPPALAHFLFLSVLARKISRRVEPDP